MVRLLTEEWTTYVSTVNIDFALILRIYRILRAYGPLLVLHQSKRQSRSRSSIYMDEEESSLRIFSDGNDYAVPRYAIGCLQNDQTLFE